MSSRAPEPNAFARDSADGKATATPSDAPASEVGNSHNDTPDPAVKETAASSQPADVPTIIIQLGLGGTPEGAQFIVCQWTAPIPKGLIRVSPAGGPDPFMMELAGRVAHYAPMLVSNQLLPLRRSEETQETAAAHLANARQILQSLISAAEKVCGEISATGELVADGPGGEVAIERQGAREAFNNLSAIEARLVLAMQLLEEPKIPAPQVGQPIEVKPQDMKTTLRQRRVRGRDVQ